MYFPHKSERETPETRLHGCQRGVFFFLRHSTQKKMKSHKKNSPFCWRPRSPAFLFILLPLESLWLCLCQHACMTFRALLGHWITAAVSPPAHQHSHMHRTASQGGAPEYQARTHIHTGTEAGTHLECINARKSINHLSFTFSGHDTTESSTWCLYCNTYSKWNLFL